MVRLALLSAVLLSMFYWTKCGMVENGTLNMLQYHQLRAHFTELLINHLNRLPRMMLLAFHDCLGGCDGCVDLNNAPSANLRRMVQLAEEFRAEHAPQLSQADVNVFLATNALDYAIRLAGGKVNTSYHIGRRDCDPSLGFSAQRFAHGRDLDSLQFLQRSFHLTPKESVALLGVHSLGRTRANGSGFDGLWDNTPFALDSKYYINIMETGWEVEQRNISILRSSQWTKNGTCRTMMLHADMIMFKNFTTSGPFDLPSCDFDECPLSDTAAFVEEFANDQESFHETLQRAFTKMVELNTCDLIRVI